MFLEAGISQSTAVNRCVENNWWSVLDDSRFDGFGGIQNNKTIALPSSGG
jgi:hypothetical protein